MTRTAETRAGVRLWIRKSIRSTVLLAAILFASAGRLDWTRGWVFVGLIAAMQTVSALVLIPNSAELLAERSRIRAGTKRWDKAVAPLAAIGGPLAVAIMAGLDARHGRGPRFGAWWYGGALVIALAANALVVWAMSANRFFSATVRIQSERGHMVASSGPYAYLRHPGYVGMMLFIFAMAVLLDSRRALVASGISAALFVVRTALEDRTLRRELQGYDTYSAKVRYRLIPWVW